MPTSVKVGIAGIFKSQKASESLIRRFFCWPLQLAGLFFRSAKLLFACHVRRACCRCVPVWVALWFASVLAAGDSPTGNIDVQVRPLGRIAPGTVIGKGPPTGWSHLIVAAFPRLGHGDSEQVSSVVKNLGSALTFSMAANVVAGSSANGGGEYRLEKVGWGLGARINGRNTVISYETCDALGANLGFLGNEVLRRNEEGLRDSFVQVAKSDSMVVCEYGALVLYRGEHRWMIVRHGMVVSPASGRLASVAWLLDILSDGRCVTAENCFQLLPPNLQEDRVFDVRRDRFTLGIPAADAFAVVKIPQGTPIAFSRTLKPLAEMRTFSLVSFRQLEAEFRRSLEGKAPL